jgi:hypothetical protein
MSDAKSKLAELASRKRKEQEEAAVQEREKQQRNAPVIDFGDESDDDEAGPSREYRTIGVCQRCVP